MKRIILAGATGLVGGYAARFLADAGHDLHVVGRRKYADAPANVTQHIAPTDEWPEIIRKVKADIAISCLGTTIKTAGSQEAFRAVDFELVRDFATAAKEAGAKHCMSISSTMANSNASAFYLKTKGQAEDALRDLAFDRLDIFRPGLLKGDRQEYRMGENIAILLSPFTDMLLHGSLRKYRSIDAETVGQALSVLAEFEGGGQFTHENDDIRRIASKNSG